ncbi:hypothetical protein NEUTE2DRAFT_127150 [Neurospora tetrasperma FGSC 2509]|nr:hypothetical protein NEUTE2DRAFT_127150 [Neurospora tetrasperma FGSC 2509]
MNNIIEDTLPNTIHLYKGHNIPLKTLRHEAGLHARNLRPPGDGPRHRLSHYPQHREKNIVTVSATTVSNIMHPTTSIVALRSEVSETAEKSDTDVNESDKSDESNYTTSDSEHEISDKDASSSSESHLNFLTRRSGLPKGLHCAHHGALWFAGCIKNDP